MARLLYLINKKRRLAGGLSLVGLALLVVLSAQAQLLAYVNTDVQTQLQKAIKSKRNGKVSTTADTYEITSSTERTSNLAILRDEMVCGP